MPVYQFRNACVTDHNVRDYNWDEIKLKLKYLAYAEETCPTTGKKHLQGFACGWKQMSLSAWKQVFPGAHIEPMRGQIRENEAYCSKEGKLKEHGEKPNENGQKNVLLGYKRKLEEGSRVEDVAEDDHYFQTYMMYRNGLHEYKRHLRRKTIVTDGFYKPHVIVRFGPPGTGKSRWVFDQYGYDNVCTMYPYRPGTFFVPPDVGDVVLFDDVQAGSIVPVSLFKTLTDGHPKKFECKGGEVWWRPKVIVFTSNFHPKEWWNLQDVDLEAVMRRITEVVEVFKDPPKPSQDGKEEVPVELSSVCSPQES